MPQSPTSQKDSGHLRELGSELFAQCTGCISGFYAAAAQPGNEIVEKSSSSSSGNNLLLSSAPLQTPQRNGSLPLPEIRGTDQ